MIHVLFSSAGWPREGDAELPVQRPPSESSWDVQTSQGGDDIDDTRVSPWDQVTVPWWVVWGCESVRVWYVYPNMPIGDELKWLLKRGMGVFSGVVIFSQKYAHLTRSWFRPVYVLVQWFCNASLSCTYLCNNRKWCLSSFVSPSSCFLVLLA